MRTEVPCNENRFFPAGIDLQGVPCEPYRVWVCSEQIFTEFVNGPFMCKNISCLISHSYKLIHKSAIRFTSKVIN